MEPPITLRERDDLPTKDTPPGPFNMFLTFEKRTTSKIRMETVSPKCPLFGGSTVYIILTQCNALQPPAWHDLSSTFLPGRKQTLAFFWPWTRATSLRSDNLACQSRPRPSGDQSGTELVSGP